MKHWVRSSVAVASLLVLAACGATKIAYKPMAGSPPPAKASVALEVVDERPADKGGTERSQVGQVRGSYGIPGAVKDSTPDVATRTVDQATTDALRQAGVGVESGGGRVLLATVKNYWMDGMVGYKATVAVEYSLQDSSGKVLWSKDLAGAAGGALVWGSAESMTQNVFANALTDLANKAATEFKSPEFQKALS